MDSEVVESVGLRKMKGYKGNTLLHQRFVVYPLYESNQRQNSNGIVSRLRGRVERRWNVGPYSVYPNYYAVASFQVRMDKV